MQPSVLVTVRVKPEIAERLEKLAEFVDRSKSYLAADAIEHYLDIQEWQMQAIKAGIAAADQGATVPFEKVKQRWGKKLQIYLTSLAENDLVEIEKFISKDNPQAATCMA